MVANHLLTGMVLQVIDPKICCGQYPVALHFLLFGWSECGHFVVSKNYGISKRMRKKDCLAGFRYFFNFSPPSFPGTNPSTTHYFFFGNGFETTQLGGAIWSGGLRPPKRELSLGDAASLPGKPHHSSPKGSMGMVYLPTFCRFLWQNVGKYTKSSHGSVMGDDSKRAESFQVKGSPAWSLGGAPGQRFTRTGRNK